MILNDVKVIGNLTADPELRHTPKGTPVAAIALGVNEPYETEAGERRQVTTFVHVRVWGPSGQNLANLAKKGTELFIEGQLRQDRWEDADTGHTRTKMYVKAQQEPASETPPRRRAHGRGIRPSLKTQTAQAARKEGRGLSLFQRVSGVFEHPRNPNP